MPDIDAFFLGPARAYYEARNQAEQAAIDRIIFNVRTDPYIDLQVKFSFPYPPYNPVLYLEGEFYVVYDFENNWTLAIWNIGKDDDSLLVPDPPDFR